MKWIVGVILSASNVVTQAADTGCAHLQVGALVEPYRHWDPEVRQLRNFPEEGLYGTKWRVVEAYRSQAGFHVHTLQLVEGEDRSLSLRYPDERPRRPGFANRFFSSNNYLKANPGAESQTCAEFRVVVPTR
jgi:hypothetical protein